MPLLAPSCIAYAWMCHYKVNVAGPVVMLFLLGFSATSALLPFHFLLRLLIYLTVVLLDGFIRAL